MATQIVEYAYDANNRMYKRILDSDGNGTLNPATVFVRCDDHIVMELERSDANAMTGSDLKTRQLWHPTQIDHHLAQENILPAKTLWTLPDHLNTVRDVVEYVSGSTSVANHITYYSFGDIAAQSDSGIVLVSYYTGRFQDFATGNRYHRERWTRPSIRIWMSEDPISFQAGDVNLYRYVGNSTSSRRDVFGLKSGECSEDNRCEVRIYAKSIMIASSGSDPKQIEDFMSTAQDLDRIQSSIGLVFGATNWNEALTGISFGVKKQHTRLE